jgi:hypothetical protein
MRKLRVLVEKMDGGKFRMTTNEEIQRRNEARIAYENWVLNACRRCEQGEVDRPELATVSYLDRARENEYRML